jgi:putative DNA primase/helicase
MSLKLSHKKSFPVETMNAHSPFSPMLRQHHYEEWVVGSGVSPEITRLNVQSLTDKREIAQRLRWKDYKYDIYGWWVSATDPLTGETLSYGQYKPDSPIKLPTQEKPSKYLGPTKEIPFDAICLRMPDSDFWKQVVEDPTVPVVITEGAKKAGAGLTIGLTTVALAGVEMGLQEGKLVPILDLLAVQGREFILAFDSDIMSKLEVKQALIRLANTLKRKGSVIQVAQWLQEEGKGMDDAILVLGADEFQHRIQQAITYKQWLKSLENAKVSSRQKRDKKGEKAPPSNQLAAKLAERHKDELAWNHAAQEWYHYGQKAPGIWTLASEVDIWNVIRAELDAKDVHYSSAYLADVARLMRCDLIVRDWEPPAHLLPMQNGVLNFHAIGVSLPEAKELQDHSPDHHFLWSLPYAYNPLATCELIQEWMLEAMGGHADRVQVLRAFLHAIVTGRTDLQRYLECTGPGGTGKSTYIRLSESLVGKENNFTTELKHLESNRFETSGIYGKRLVTITDSERYGGNVTVLKALTGSDTVRAEIKYKQQQNGFKPTCMVVVAANEVIQSADYTSGLQRRRLSVPFEVKPKERRDLEAEFQPLIPGLLNWVLAMDPEEVKHYLVNTEAAAPSLAQTGREALCEVNPLADWLNSHLLHVPEARTQVGIALRCKSHEDPHLYQDTDRYLYANYAEYSEVTGSQKVCLRRFSSLLLDLCRSQLQWDDVRKDRDRYGAHFLGLALRTSQDTDPPPITSPPVTDPPSPVTDNVTAETPACDGSDECDGSVGETSTIKTPSTDPSSDQNSQGNLSKNPSHPSHLSPEPIPTITPPITSPSDPSQPHRKHYLPPIRAGDICIYAGPRGHYLAGTCKRDDLKVLSIQDDEATVHTARWFNPIDIKLSYLRKKRSDDLN